MCRYLVFGLNEWQCKNNDLFILGKIIYIVTNGKKAKMRIKYIVRLSKNKSTPKSPRLGAKQNLVVAINFD